MTVDQKPRQIEAECHIIIPPFEFRHLKQLLTPEPRIASDEEIEEAFPDWRQRAKQFAARCYQAEGKDPTELSSADFFRYGMKFMICESVKQA